MVFTILRKHSVSGGSFIKYKYIQFHLVYQEQFYQPSNGQASDSSVLIWWPFSLGSDIMILSTLLFLFCLLCWDLYLNPSFKNNADTKGPFSH